MPILFCNVGWMEHYQGLRTGDKIRGGGAHVRQFGRGHEICNFSPYRGKLYGYVQPTGKQIKIGKLGAEKDSAFIDGVTVVWTANRPGIGTVVVGWYKNARVFREFQAFEKASSSHRKDGVDTYAIKANAEDATLLPIDARTLTIPRREKGGMGQSNVWFASDPKSASLVKKILEWIEHGKNPERKTGKAHGKQDQQRKVAVEKAAIFATCKYYENLGYQVRSVEKENLGWDLIAVSATGSLRIEVKGLSGLDFSIGLTPKEYVAFLAKADDYRLAVVVDALDSPRLSMCRFSAEHGDWVVEGSEARKLTIRPMESAMISCA